MALKDKLLRSVGAQYAAGEIAPVENKSKEEWINNSRKNEEMEQKWKQCPLVDVTDDGSEVRCYKEQYCIGTWNVRSMNQGKLEVVKEEMASVNINILGISELKWLEWMSLTQMTIISTTVGKNPLEEIDTSSKMQYLSAISKMTEWSVYFQGKWFSITVIQVYAPNSNAEEAEIEWF